MKVLGLALASLGVAVGLSAADSASARSLESELAYLLTAHPQIKAAQKAVESSAQEIARARAQFLPQVNMTADIGPEITDGPGQRGRGDNKGDITRTGITTSITTTQNLFNGYASISAERTAQLNKWIAYLTLEGTRQGVLLEGINAYINVLRQKRLVELSRLNETNIQNQLNLEDERVQRGSGIAVDVLQAKSRLQLAKERRVSFEGALQNALSTYLQVFNRLPEVEDMTDPVPPVASIPSTLEGASEIALRENPAMTNATATSQVTRERRRTTMAEYYPTLDLVGTWTFEKNKAAVVGVSREYTLLLQANWNLFTGFTTRASLAQVAFDYGATRDNREFISRRVIEQTELSWQGLLTVSERLVLLENAVNIASEVFDSRKKLRDAGKETVINVLDAESEIFNAQINYAAASYDRRLAVYQILLAMGQLKSQQLNLASN